MQKSDEALFKETSSLVMIDMFETFNVWINQLKMNYLA